MFCDKIIVFVQAKGLADVWGDEFEALYEQYERENKARRTVPAQELWFAVLSSQVETGTPYMLFKDACNRKVLPHSS